MSLKKMFQKQISAAELSIQCSVLILLALTVSVTANDLSTTGRAFHKSAKGQRLTNCLISEKIVSNLIECGQWCLREGCHSLNYGQNKRSKRRFACQLNNSSKENCSTLRDEKFDYYETIKEEPQWRSKNGKSCAEKSFSLLFPRRGIKDYVQLDDPAFPGLSTITICYWVKFASSGRHTTLSYACSNHHNEITNTYRTDSVRFFLKGRKTEFKTLHDVATADIWRAMCFTWSNVGGNIAVYENGTKIGEKSGVLTGQRIIGNGKWVLGQDQDEMGGGFSTGDAFKGEISEVNVWGRVLTKQDISSFSMGCQRRMNGDVRSWPEFRTGHRGQVRVLVEPTCKK